MLGLHVAGVADVVEAHQTEASGSSLVLFLGVLLLVADILFAVAGIAVNWRRDLLQTAWGLTLSLVSASEQSAFGTLLVGVPVSEEGFRAITIPPALDGFLFVIETYFGEGSEVLPTVRLLVAFLEDVGRRGCGVPGIFEGRAVSVGRQSLWEMVLWGFEGGECVAAWMVVEL